jgi:hypothetical protein
VYQAVNINEADIIVAWLAKHGIQALTKDEYVVTALVPFGAGGVHVCVVDPDDAERARTLLEKHANEIKRREAYAEGSGVAMVTCPECGVSNEFAPETRGDVAACPDCGAYIDIPID